MIDLVQPPAAGEAEGVASEWAALEHRAGVLPLLAAFFALPEAFPAVAAGRVRGSLGLFTPAAEPGWRAAAVAAQWAGERPGAAEAGLAAEPAGGGLVLRGDVRLPSAAAQGSIVLARLADGEHRLAWVDHDAPGVERRGSRSGGAAGAVGGPCWLHLEEVAIAAERVSRPVTLGPEGELARLLAGYAGVWAAAAAFCARDGARALRRAARLQSLHTSQQVALGITAVEIEADLTVLAVEGPGSRVAVAAAAARTLSAVAARSAELCDAFGLDVAGPFGAGGRGSARTLTAFCGGWLLLASELAREIGIPEAGG